MTVRVGGSLEPTKKILRLVRKIPRFVPTGKPPINGEAFEPSSADRDEADRTSLPVRVSVWDLTLTTVSQAKAFRAEEELLPMRLLVADVHEVRAMFTLPRMDVVADPLDDERPGAVGHCGIEGLDRQADEQKKTYKAARDELARRAMLIDA